MEMVRNPSSWLYVFVGYCRWGFKQVIISDKKRNNVLGIDPTQNLAKDKRWLVMCAPATSQWKHCDYVIHAYSMSIKQKMVKSLPCLLR